MKVIRVTCAIIQQSNQILVTQRSAQMSLPCKWEFPGGKIEVGEDEETCILREIKEELGIDIKLLGKLPSNTHDYGNIIIELIPFRAKYLGGSIDLKEHMDYAWLTFDELGNLDWAPADIPIVESVIQHKSGRS
ncbi:MAG TPA: (deoxy)nucleoside triphosphate pyrophosphohydrolase [Saprospiraceae bacterium]|nr:(deoxy)nucleoside triphosphate pyrophosphohydrolase [Saprospiraceae bacterium]HPN71066.1 (deoxy)nucleoside triphosphate pyrophosphohydrolase [Saprospiraceae bacterium]